MRKTSSRLFYLASKCYFKTEMINLLEGKIEFKGERFSVINVGGVGYRVYSSHETLSKMPEKDRNVKLWTYLYVREGVMELYGFLNPEEVEFFETLINVPGIGPKGGLGIMSIAPLVTLKKAIASGDISYLTRVSGIGKKTAEKIVLELKDKMDDKETKDKSPELKEEIDMLEALVALGYSQREAREVLAEVPPEISGVEQRIRWALKNLGVRKSNL